jgi:low affinity Fe/Cu permease
VSVSEVASSVVNGHIDERNIFEGGSMEHSVVQKRMSRVLHWIGDLTSRSTTTVVVVLLLVIFGVILAADGFPMSWEAAFSTIAGAVTLVMLFVVQHTQGRNHLVLQLKLDELIRSSPVADDLLVRLEVADDSEINDLEQDQLAHHESLRESDALATLKERDEDA